MSAHDQREGAEGRFKGRLGTFELDAAFSIAAIGITALVGPSGSGKTTLMRCIAGLMKLPGRLTVDGEIWQEDHVFLPAHRRAVGVVFQDASLLEHLSVTNNLLYGQRRTRAPQTIQFDEVVALLGLENLLSRSVRHLSGGERQRVALGRALLSQPRLLLMDEPLSSLDAESRAEILPYLERLPTSLSMPALYISHDMQEVQRLAAHRLVMRDGRVVQSDLNIKSADSADLAAQLAGMSEGERDRLALAALQAGLKP